MIERTWDGEQGLVYARLFAPESKPLTLLAEELRTARETPFQEFHAFRALRITGRLPRLIRRALWWYAFNSGHHRPRFFGTFGVTVLGHRGVQHVVPLAPVTSVLTLGPFQADGTVEVTIGFDHRVMDGATIADAFDRFEAHLDGTVADELRSMKRIGLEA